MLKYGGLFSELNTLRLKYRFVLVPFANMLH
jgi:hypothetical protein